MAESLESLIARCFRRPEREISDELTPDDVEGWDSLGHLLLMTEVERAYGVSLTPEDMLAAQGVGLLRSVLRDRGVPV